MTKQTETTKPDIVLEHWKDSKITVESPTGHKETLSIKQLADILHNIHAEEIENALEN